MTRLRIGTSLLVSATLLALAAAPAFAQTDTESLTKKDAPTGRQRLTPRTAEGQPLLAGVPGYDNTMPSGSLHGFGPMTGNPLLDARPVQSSGDKQ